MRKLRTLALASASSLAAMSMLMAACSDEDTVVPPDAGWDGSSDSSADTRPDSTGPDSGIVDAKADALSARELVTEIERAVCSSFTRCCFGAPDLPDHSPIDGGFDGGSAQYNLAKCIERVRPLNFEYAAANATLDGVSAFTIDQAKAAQCLDRVKKLTCDLATPEFQAARKACFEAFMGSRGSGDSCKASIECKQGLFCDPTSGKCASLRSQGQPCAVFNTPDASALQVELDSYRNEEACSWRGSADTNLRCNSYDFAAQAYRPYSEWTCEPKLGLGSDCNDTRWCTDGICDPNGYVCESPVAFADNVCGLIIDQP